MSLNFKIYNGVLQFSIIFFSVALLWFAAIYYPKMLSQVKTQPVIKKSLVSNVSASTSSLPFENVYFRISYNDRSKSFYVFVKGASLPEYVVNKERAELFLKSALSLDSLCGTNVIYLSVSELKVPSDYLLTSHCK